MNDEFFMNFALKQAEKAFELGEVPVGAVIVKDNQIISYSHNQVEFLKDATAHAEILSLKAAFSALSNWRLTGCTLYSTLEPCSMCLGAIFLARIDKVVWGAKDIRHGACGSWVDLLSQKHPIHNIEVVSGVLEEPSSLLLKSFFKKRREENKHGICSGCRETI